MVANHFTRNFWLHFHQTRMECPNLGLGLA